MHYQDFELEISRNGNEGDYIAKARSLQQGEAQQPFFLPDAVTLENLILKMRGFSRSVRSANSPEVEAASRFGELLFVNAFGGEISNLLKSCLDHTTDDIGLRIKLILQDAPELSALPWEFLYLPRKRDFLAHSPTTPIVRYLKHAEAINPLAVTLPLKLLVLIASPFDLPALDIAKERRELQNAVAKLEQEGALQIKWIEHATVESMADALEEDSFHLLHFIGHSHFDQRQGEGALVFEDERGRSDYYEAGRLKVLLHDHHTLRLVVLNSCEGAMQDVNDPFSSIATTLMLAGIPAVIAMQFEISDQAAITFAKIFYKWLAKGTAIDKAVGEARKYLFAVERNNVEWGTPVLYLRAKDGELFALDSKVPEQEKAIQEKLAKEKLEQEKRLEQERLAQEQTVQIKKTRQEIIELPNNVISEMIYIPAGEFLMGSAQGEEGTGSDEYPQHKVTVPAFYMAKYPVTQAQYQAVMGENPSHFKGNDHPVESVSWNDAKTFCQKLSALTGAAYRLPSEAEWEYACRAGTTTKWWFGDNEAELEKYAWYDKNAGVKFLFFGGQTSPVGQKPANPYGLYDMHGNVWEWCEDVWHGNYNGAPNDATAWISGGDQSLRVIRGGSWSYDPVWLRSAYRYNFTPDSRSGDLGFRLSRM